MFFHAAVLYGDKLIVLYAPDFHFAPVFADAYAAETAAAFLHIYYKCELFHLFPFTLS
jgi:hypothetical protein